MNEADPNAEVIALSPTTLMATNRFVCEICNKGFQRDQNLQLHRRGHNLPWKLRQRPTSEVTKKRVYVCPEPSCVHHNPSRALGDLTGIKKHFSRKHGEKKWKCDKCSKKYAVHSDWKAHHKTCGSREYKCDCGTVFSRRDSFITHRAFCDALAQENNRVGGGLVTLTTTSTVATETAFKSMCCGGMFSTSTTSNSLFGIGGSSSKSKGITTTSSPNNIISSYLQYQQALQDAKNVAIAPLSTTTVVVPAVSPHMSATALLQKAAQMGATSTTNSTTIINSSPIPIIPSSSSPSHHQLFHQRGTDQISPLFDTNNNEVGMLSQMLMMGNSNNNVGEQEGGRGSISSVSSSLMDARDVNVTFGGGGGSDMSMTTIHDFLGLGASPAPNFHDFHSNHADWSNWKQF